MRTKQADAALIQLLENGIREVGNLSSDRFYIVVRRLKVTGEPPERFRASVLLRFLPAGAPFCCGEPACYSVVFCDEGAKELGDFLRRKMGLKHSVEVELEVTPEYFDGIKFTELPGN